MITFKEIEKKLKDLRKEHGEGHIARLLFYKNSKLLNVTDFYNAPGRYSNVLSRGNLSSFMKTLLERCVRECDSVEVILRPE